MIVSINRAVLVNSDGSSFDNEYFSATYTNNVIEFEPSQLSNPSADVPSKLVITYVDMFAHTKTISLDIIVKKN
jgi:hypothetical protein